METENQQEKNNGKKRYRTSSRQGKDDAQIPIREEFFKEKNMKKATGGREKIQIIRDVNGEKRVWDTSGEQKKVKI